MPLSPRQRTTLARLVERDRQAREAVDQARAELVTALQEARGEATVRELADATGLSFQRIQKIVGPKP